MSAGEMKSVPMEAIEGDGGRVQRRMAEEGRRKTMQIR
jgi:hypothetical protein